MKVIQSTYLTKWFFALFVGVIFLYVLAFSFPSLEFIANIVLASLFALTLIDVLFVYSNKEPIGVKRQVNNRLNLGDENKVKLTVKNNTGIPLSFTLIEGYPVEMQDRTTVLRGLLTAESEKVFEYTFTPKKRGEYLFGNVFIIVRSVFFLASRRINVPLEETIHVYPSVLQM